MQKPHVVVMAYPAPGHLIPSIDLAKLLAQKGLAVSFATTPGNVSFLHGSLLQPPLFDIRLLILPTPLVEGLDGRERMDLLPPESRILITEMVEKLQHPFQIWMEEQFQQQTTATPPVCIVYDLFVPWAVDTAQRFNIASVMFNTCSAFASSVMQSMACSISQNTLERDEEDGFVVSFNLPRTLRLSKHEVCPVFANPDLSIPVQRFINQCIQDIGKGSGLLINTFNELEPFYVQHLKSLTGKPVWAIGPVNAQNLCSTEAGNVNTRAKMVEMDEAELVCWLDLKSPRSVVYVSFGSLTVLSKEQAHALATGLEASEQAFVWAIKMEPKADLINSAYLPEGFLERTKGRGLVIRGWAPQLVILSHSSVGAFISHCGWNSALESISLGVPILAWPMFYDQHFNSKLFAELGVGIQFCENVGKIPKEERVKEVVRIAVSGKEGDEMRERAGKLKEMARDGMKEKGSSAADLTAFVSHMYNLNSKPTEEGREVESNLIIN